MYKLFFSQKLGGSNGLGFYKKKIEKIRVEVFLSELIFKIRKY